MDHATNGKKQILKTEAQALDIPSYMYGLYGYRKNPSQRQLSENNIYLNKN